MQSFFLNFPACVSYALPQIQIKLPLTNHLILIILCVRLCLNVMTETLSSVLKKHNATCGTKFDLICLLLALHLRKQDIPLPHQPEEKVSLPKQSVSHLQCTSCFVPVLQLDFQIKKNKVSGAHRQIVQPRPSLTTNFSMKYPSVSKKSYSI